MKNFDIWFRQSPPSRAGMAAWSDIRAKVEREPPLRSELFNAEQMAAHGIALAESHRLREGKGGTGLLDRLGDNEKVLRETCALLAAAINEQRRTTPAGEWLLDNLYLIDEQIRTALRHFPKRYSWELPLLDKGASAGLPRVYDIARNAISHGDGRVDQDSLSRFVASYQQVRPLKLGELWAIPIMLRLALIENLRRVAARIASDRLNRDLAGSWADRMIAIVAKDPKGLILVVADMARSDPPVDGSFVSEMTRRLQGHGAALSLPLTWIEQWLGETGLTIDQVVQTENQHQAADQVSISNSVTSLRLISATDWRDFVESLSHVEQRLRGDPAGVYSQMDFASRDACRHVVERMAQRSACSEIAVAEHAIALAHEPSRLTSASNDAVRHHVGYYLVGDGRARLNRLCEARPYSAIAGLWSSGRVPFVAYASLIVGLMIAFSAPPILRLFDSHWPAWFFVLVCALVLLGMSQLALTIANWFAAMLALPHTLQRMDYSNGIPEAERAVVVVPTLLTSAASAEELVSDLEVRFLANRDAQLRFALLTDFADASAESMPDDDSILAAATAAIEDLNRRYAPESGHIFFLLHRPRRWNASEGRWMGVERKRGKLADLNALLRGHGAAHFSLIVGNPAALNGVRYVITLDTDTRLPHDAARRLVATLAHPLNRPQVDPQRRVVVSGYGILQPRIGTSISGQGTTAYSALFGGDPGLDPYTRAVSDVYQDLFAEGSFIGKGIYDVDAFELTLAERFPDNRILSHDLLEGCYARCGLVTDIELYENYPSSYRTDIKRRHRWMRGDWQLSAWLWPRTPMRDGRREDNPLSPLSRGKILDNLRRSCVPIALFALIVLGWTHLAAAGFWTLVVLEIMLLPALVDSVLVLIRKPAEALLGQHIAQASRSAGQRLQQALFAIACLPYEAWVSVDAIARTLWRKYVSRRRLLEWTPSAIVERRDHDSLIGSLLRMASAPLAAIGTACVLLATRPESLLVAAPVLLLWSLSPALAWWLSRPPRPSTDRLDSAQRQFLRGVARRTWAFFERFVSAEENWLPPDNFQEAPLGVIAHRTSPTNIGMSLLATLTAHDFGYLSLRAMLLRTQNTLATLERMNRYRGHFYNWYETRSLQPMLPLYVSTVDSGNLAGHLLILRQGLLQLADRPIVSARVFTGLADTLGVLRDTAPTLDAGLFDRLQTVLDDFTSRPSLSLADVRSGLERAIAGIEHLMAATTQLAAPAAIEWAGALQRQAREAHDDIIALTARATLHVEPSAATDPISGSTAIPSLNDLANTMAPTADAAPAIECLQRIDRLADICADLTRIDYSFLHDSTRHLFAIGYNVSDGKRDSGYYDLLASEVRLGVFVAIAQGYITQESWFSLGRLLTQAGRQSILLSWSGSMFEYLMPMMVMPSFPGSLLDETCTVAVQRQIAYGRQRNVPWGISESGYYLTDAAQNYQYRAFGVPGLGLQRGLAQELVIAPYASALALAVMPTAAVTNLQRMAALGWLARYGFYEAVDFTPARLPRGESAAIVRSFMAHHQGMSLLGISYALLDRPMQQRFEADPQFQASLLLLQERVPRTSGQFALDPGLVDVRSAADTPQVPLRVFTRPDHSRPAVQLLSNGRYHVMLTSAGSGYSRWRDIAVTRWREDAVDDAWGTFMYIRDCANDRIWSTSFQPALATTEAYEAVFTEPRVEFRRRADHLESHTEIIVSPEDDIELRRTRISNRSRLAREIEITSYAEVVLAPAMADALHPAFSNLFVQTEIVRARNAIVCTRRPRAAHEVMPWMVHLVTVHDAATTEVSFETDRMQFIGRGNTIARPQAMRLGHALSDSEGSVLDPIVSVRHRVRLGPDQTICVDMVTGVADSRKTALALADKYFDRRLADRVIDLAWTHGRLALGQINVSEADAQTYCRLAGCVLFSNRSMRADAAIVARNRRGQSGLWAYAISGDLPIVLLQISDPANLDLVHQLVKAHAYWRLKGLIVDLVIWNEERGGYRQMLQDEIVAYVSSSVDVHLVDRPGGIFLRAADQIPHEDRNLMQSVARVIVSDRNGPLGEQLRRRDLHENVLPRLIPSLTAIESGSAPQSEFPSDLQLFNGHGGFSADGREYVIRTSAGQRTPAPWINVLANADFGCIVSESGVGYTWKDNAHEYRLTPWHDDPVGDASGEAIYLRDEESGEYWSPTPLPACGRGGYLTRHGFGYSVFEHIEAGIATELWIYVAPDAAVKFFVLKLRNESGRARRLSVSGYMEWVLGDLAAKTGMHVVTELDPNSGALLARNSFNGEFPDLVAFFDVDDTRRTISGDRVEFIGRNGNLQRPAAMDNARLSGRVGALMDPCGAIQIPIELDEEQSREVIFRVGVGRTLDDASNMVLRFRRSGTARAALEATRDYWSRTLGVVQVDTPDPALNLLANGWLLYQVIVCRLWARSGFYQSGGAFGFRDQLQDAMALVHSDPVRLRAQVLLCASRQFREGDVQHWWHPPHGRGVRTQCSDDYLWLPLAACRYVQASGDSGVLDEPIHFLEGRQLSEGEESYYDLPLRAEEQASLYEHCKRAIGHGLRFGMHGLPLIGSGDWNDGMSNVGREGRGESVWLAFFLYRVLMDFVAVARMRGDEPFARRCIEQAAQLQANIELHGWDGEWYRRAYFDEGTPLGSAANIECKIDSISQSWSVLSRAGSSERTALALDALDRYLVKPEAKLVQLLDPPFDKSAVDPGYIRGYVPGVRENGGQYTHAAIWAAMAFAEAGRVDKAWQVFDLINPLRHALTPDAVATYKVEPYVAAADVYAVPPHTGRGGWTWYTGSAGWMYRLIVESLLGIRRESDRLLIDPRIPPHWPGFSLTYRNGSSSYAIEVRRDSDVPATHARIDGNLMDADATSIALADDGLDHRVEIVIASRNRD